MSAFSLLAVALCALLARAQTPPSTFPHVYPGQPSGDLSPEWQNYFQVNDSLPNVTFPLTRSFAGSIPVNRADHPNDTLFFWAFEKENGSLTTDGSTDPWVVWLQGGPGSSSMAGLVLENGPIRVQDDLSMKANNYSWSKLVDQFWVDNPVGVGFATADSTGYVFDDDQMSTDFIQFLINLVKVFPGLASRPLYIAGESYGGRWIPYVAKAIFQTPNPPVKLAKIVIGDGTVGEFPVTQDLPTVSIIETYPQVIDYDTDVLQYFREQEHLCGYDLNLTYPQTGGFFPTLKHVSAADSNSPYSFSGAAPTAQRNLHSSSARSSAMKKRSIVEYARRTAGMKRRSDAILTKREIVREVRRQVWKRDLSLRANGTIDPWYACFLQDELYDYMVNYTLPWSLSPNSLDVYDIPDGLEVKPATSPGSTLPPVFFQDNQTVATLHAPTSVSWVESAQYPFNGSYSVGDTSPDPQVFLNELAANASAKGVSIVFYSGNDDSLLAHRGTEVTIQNTTFGGIQGFSRKPATPWFDDDGTFAGIVHQERNWTYVLFEGASHLVPQKKPAAAFVFLREFLLGNNQTGLVVNASGSSGDEVVGGEVSSLAGDFIPGQSEIFAGSIVTTATITYPSATVTAWNKFVSNLVVADTKAATSTGSVAVPRLSGRGIGVAALVFMGLAVCLS
ncbi:alpha/beta-hydrolase [Phellopilus nigrolimitatus]|nr:alpha/beta-hydrolase [Phellopilus nigrolimitatus]